MVDLRDIGEKRLSEANLTVQELLTLVDAIVTERLKGIQPAPDDVSSGDWWQSMIDDLIVPEPGTPSATAMLQQERDQWYKPS